MKSKSKITFTIIAVAILTGSVFFFWQRGPHLPRAQTPQPPGTFIPKNQLVFASYKTPEAALKSVIWAWVHGDYDTSIASFPVKQQAEMRKRLRNPKAFQIRSKKEFSQLQGFEIMARKNLSNDKVELKFETIGSGFYKKDGTNFTIIPAVKIDNEWKFPGDYVSYETNWDGNGDVIILTN